MVYVELSSRFRLNFFFLNTSVDLKLTVKVGHSNFVDKCELSSAKGKTNLSLPLYLL